MVQRNLVEGIVVHEVVQLTIIIQILHLLCFDVCLGEFIVGVERFFSCSTCQNIFVFCSYESSTLSWFYVLEFNDRVAREVMIPRQDMVCLFTDDTLEENLDTIRRSCHTRYPLCEEDKDHVLGMIHVRDLMDHTQDKDFDLRSILRNIVVVSENMSGAKVLQMMQDKRIQLAVVVDEYGGTSGIVTMEDLLESIVGNMQDEYDQEEEEYQKLSDTIFVLDGSMSVDDVEELLGMNIGPEEDYDTLSGMITDLLDCIPAKDEHPSVQVGNVKFTVLATDERRISKLRAEILPVPEQTDEE